MCSLDFGSLRLIEQHVRRERLLGKIGVSLVGGVSLLVLLHLLIICRLFLFICLHVGLHVNGLLHTHFLFLVAELLPLFRQLLGYVGKLQIYAITQECATKPGLFFFVSSRFSLTYRK